MDVALGKGPLQRNLGTAGGDRRAMRGQWAITRSFDLLVQVQPLYIYMHFICDHRHHCTAVLHSCWQLQEAAT